MDAGGTTPRMGEVESRLEQRLRATHGAVADDCMDTDKAQRCVHCGDLLLSSNQQ